MIKIILILIFLFIKFYLKFYFSTLFDSKSKSIESISHDMGHRTPRTYIT